MRGSLWRLVLIAVTAMPTCVHAEWSFGASAQARYNDNVGGAMQAADIIGDEILAAQLSLAQYLALGNDYALSLGGEVQGEWYRHLDGLDALGADVAIALRRKWGLGAYAPWMRATFSIGRNAVNDAYRNTTRYRATLGAGKRLNARTNLWMEYSFERRDAKPHGEEFGLSNDAFTGNGHALALNMELNLTDRLALGAGLSVRHGDVVATTRPGYAIYAPSRAVADDEAFGDEFYAYRLVGTTYGARLGVHYALGDHHLLGMSFAHFDTRAQGGNDYKNSIPEITWEYRF